MRRNYSLFQQLVCDIMTNRGRFLVPNTEEYSTCREQNNNGDVVCTALPWQRSGEKEQEV